MSKQMMFDDDVRRKILAGVRQLARAVKVTLGPRGKNVIYQKGFGGPTVTKDGVTVAREIEIADPFENMGAKMVNEVASKTNDKAGDGTTTATILAEAIFAEGLRVVASGANPVMIKRGIDKAVAVATASLKTAARPVKNSGDIAKIGTISANGNSDVGDLLAAAIDKVGRDGVITVEEAKGTSTELVVVNGMQFDKGFISPYFITDTGNMSAVLENAYVVIYDKKISNLRQIVTVLEAVAQKGQPLLIIAEDVEAEALSALVINRLRGVMNVCAVKAPGFGDRRKAMLEDIAILTGAQCISEDLGEDIESIGLSHLGSAKRIEVTKDETLIIEGGGKKGAVKERADQIRTQIEKTTSDYDREKLQERLGKLAGGVASIRVGAPTEKEMSEKKDLVDDALHATRAAVEEGVVSGGGTALLDVMADVEAGIAKLKGDEKLGGRVVLAALRVPAAQIAENAGFDGSVCVAETLESTKKNWGFDAAAGKHVDMLKAGIIDPVKVTRSALENAAGVAGLMLTTNTAITNLKESEDPIMGAIS
ncbi:MAG: chaperonin GroEL [Planctomycetota bacterium]|jgi:chaperonin GroEL